MKKYIVEFTEPNGNTFQFEFITDDIKKSISQYTRNRSIISHSIISEGSGGKKQMLFG